MNDTLLSFIQEGTPEDVIERYRSLPEVANSTDFGEYDSNVVVIDTETTGVSFKKDKLTQIAAAKIMEGKVTDWFVTFVNPGHPIPEEIVHLTGITDDDVADAPSVEEALTSLVKFVGDAKLVAHNAEFDKHFTTAHPAGYPLLENTWIDSLELSRISLPRLRSHRLFDLVQAFDLPVSTHRADDDVAATCALYRILLAAVSVMPPALVSEISRLTTPDVWPTGKVFAFFSAENMKKGAAESGLSIDEYRVPNFSLKAIRRDRVSAQNIRPRQDAANMVSAVLASNANIRITSFGSSGTGISEYEAFGVGAGAATYQVGEPAIEDVSFMEEDLELAAEAGAADAAGAAGEGLDGDLNHDGGLNAGEPNSARFRQDGVGNTVGNNDGSTDGVKDGVKEIVFPTPGEIEGAFTEDGLVGSQYEQFENRIEQLEMSLAVRDAFATSSNLVVEAGTGVGKSMAYLVPAVLTAHRNKITIGVATKTNALLDQLVFKELPALQKSLGEELVFTALKGFSHYPCLRKIQRIAREGAQIRMVQNEERTQAPAIAALLSYIEQTSYGDLDNLKIDYRTLPKRSITTTSHECLRRKCPFYGLTCYVHGARRRAEASDIVVTNHSLLFCDVAADGGLLPPIRYWVVDEAHGSENEARQALSLKLSVDEINQLSSRVGDGETTRNVFVRAERNLVAPDTGKVSSTFGASDAANAAGSAGSSGSDKSGIEDAGTLFFGLIHKAKEAGRNFADAADIFCSHVKDLLYFDTQKRSSYDIIDVWINDEVKTTTIFAALASYAQEMVDRSEKLIGCCQNLVGFLDDFENAAVIQREIAAVAIELKEIINAANTIFVNPTDAYVYSATLSKKSAEKAGKGLLGRDMNTRNVIEALPFNVGVELNETLYANTRSIIFTSATISINNSFEAFEQAMGLNSGDGSRTTELMLKSSYDFDKNMTVYVVKDMPEPTDPKYLDALKELLVDAHIAQHGSMLTLFTNKKEMENCYSDVNSALKQEDLRLVCQRWGVSVKGLRDEFLADETVSLFALKSFWEGFDAPGSTLRGVVIPKLPFTKPTDPLSCERSKRDDYAWRNYVLPQAVIDVKQAAGRLIRRADDTGSFILADSRVVSKGYGKVFLRSLPSQNIHIVTRDELIEGLRK